MYLRSIDGNLRFYSDNYRELNANGNKNLKELPCQYVSACSPIRCKPAIFPWKRFSG